MRYRMILRASVRHTEAVWRASVVHHRRAQETGRDETPRSTPKVAHVGQARASVANPA
jgi:hypothetical protein